MPNEAVFFLSAITVVGGFVLLFPVVRALAERIRARPDAALGRLLAKQRAAERLAPPGGS